jgi:hypothetical protein
MEGGWVLMEKDENREGGFERGSSLNKGKVGI